MSRNYLASSTSVPYLVACARQQHVAHPLAQHESPAGIPLLRASNTTAHTAVSYHADHSFEGLWQPHAGC